MARDRPGLLGDIINKVRGEGRNINAILGNPSSVLIDVDDATDSLINAIANVDGVDRVFRINAPFTAIGFLRDALTNALTFYSLGIKPELLERLGHEYGRELTRLLRSRGEGRIPVIFHMLTAMGMFSFINTEVKGDYIIIRLRQFFDEHIGSPITRGILKGILDVLLGSKYELSIKNVGDHVEAWVRIKGFTV